MKSRLLLGKFLCFLAMFSGAAALLACELPAEPCAAVVPSVKDPNYQNIALVKDESDDTYFFLVPENSEMKLLIRWDPYDHNGENNQEKYDYVKMKDKGNVPLDPDAPIVDGRGYFPLEAMTAFFKVTGNRNSIIEAFNRQVGNPPNNAFISAMGVGPGNLLRSSFVHEGQGGKITIYSGSHATTFPYASLLDFPGGDDIDVGDLNDAVPNDTKSFSPKVITQGTTRQTVTYKFGQSGIQTGQLNVNVTEIKNEDYKAYILEGPPNVWMDENILPILPENTDGGVGNEKGELMVKFHTPTVGGPPIKVKVNSPSAGFEITNLFWCWVEEVVVEIFVDEDPDDEIPGAWKYDHTETHECSVGLKVIVTKPPTSGGWTAFKVYPTRGPIASKLVVNGGEELVLNCAEKEVVVPFTLTTFGTDPFADKPALIIDETGKLKPIEHNTDKMKDSVKLFMSYPVYKFFPVSDISPTDLGDPEKGNVGLLEFADAKAPKWKGWFYTQQWVWKAADTITIASKTFTQLYADGSTLWGGGCWILEGEATFNAAVPQHFANQGASISKVYDAHGAKYPSPSGDDPKKLWKVFAITKDASGLPSPSYDEIIAAVDPNLDSADENYPAGRDIEAVRLPNDLSADAAVVRSYNQRPPLSNSINGDFEPSGNDYKWQKYQPIYSRDKDIPPELQLIVFDTRNNSYHIFGTNKGGDSRLLSGGVAPTFEAYRTANPPLYGVDDNKNINDALKFEAYKPELFGRFIDKNMGGASSLNDSDGLAGNGFVCQTNTRLVFYIRAWDNINTFATDSDKPSGVEKISYEVNDWFAPSSDNLADQEAGKCPPKASVAYNRRDLIEKPVVWQFRAPNVDASGNYDSSKPCNIIVKAKDASGAERTLTLNVYVIGSDLSIRSLEEKRNRKQ